MPRTKKHPKSLPAHPPSREQLHQPKLGRGWYLALEIDSYMHVLWLMAVSRQPGERKLTDK